MVPRRGNWADNAAVTWYGLLVVKNGQTIQRQKIHTFIGNVATVQNTKIHSFSNLYEQSCKKNKSHHSCPLLHCTVYSLMFSAA